MNWISAVVPASAPTGAAAWVRVRDGFGGAGGAAARGVGRGGGPAAEPGSAHIVLHSGPPVG
jgi:hypothetical protein